MTQTDSKAAPAGLAVNAAAGLEIPTGAGCGVLLLLDRHRAFERGQSGQIHCRIDVANANAGSMTYLRAPVGAAAAVTGKPAPACNDCGSE